MLRRAIVGVGLVLLVALRRVLRLLIAIILLLIAIVLLLIAVVLLLIVLLSLPSIFHAIVLIARLTLVSLTTLIVVGVGLASVLGLVVGHRWAQQMMQR